MELNDGSGALVKVTGTPFLDNSHKNGEEIALVVNGKNTLGVSYIYILEFSNGKLSEKEMLISIKNGNIINPVIINNDYDKYVAWLENNNKDYILKIKSSNLNFGANPEKMMLYIRLGNIIQNIFLMVLTFITKIIWILPGCTMLIIFRIVKKDKWHGRGIVIIAAILANIIFQILFYGLPELFGFRYERIIITLIISLISALLILLYKYEKREVSYLRLYIVFTVISMIFISTLYAPYTLEGGMDRLRQTEMFKRDEME